jgi:hypothetical protein
MPEGGLAITGRADEATRASRSPTDPLCYPFSVVSRAESVIVNGRRYLRAPVPVHFPVQEIVPEGGVHLELRTALFLLLRAEFAGRAFVGSDQFLYWDAVNPAQCVAPDVMVRLGAPDAPVACWKVWEGGAPHVAVEIVSPTDTSDRNWSAKLERYRRSGVQELVRFDPEDAEHPLGLWDRVEHDLVERDVGSEAAHASAALELYWCVTPDTRLGRKLGLSLDANGTEPILTLEERRAKAAEAQRDAALARVAELEAELRRR